VVAVDGVADEGGVAGAVFAAEARGADDEFVDEGSLYGSTAAEDSPS